MKMTAHQYREALEVLGLTRRKAGEFLGVTLRTSQRYALGECRVPESTAKLLRLMIKLKLKPSDVD
jgi:hypothetical protein